MLIENIVFVSNNRNIYNLYILNCIKSLNYRLLDNFFKKRTLILSSLNYSSIFSELVEIFSNRIINKDYKERYILKIWNLIFPYVEKYLDYELIKHSINNGYHESGINNIVALRKSYLILPQIEQYIDDWNTSDFYEYTPILDAIRYSSINTVKYILDPQHNINLLCKSYDNNNILTCALYNSDIRVIKYIHELIKNDDILKNYIKSFDKIYCYIFKCIQAPVFKKFRIKFDILIDICGNNLIDYFVNQFMLYDSFIKHIIKKYNYKLTFSKYDEPYIIKENKCSQKTLEYLKLLVDNTDFNSNDFNYRNFINFIVTYGCINMGIEILDYAKSKYNIKKLHLDNYQLYITFLKSITLNVYLKPNNCKCITYNDCEYDVVSKSNKDKLFEKYIDYLFKNIIVKEESIIYNTFYKESDEYNYNSIAPILFKYGIYPDTFSLGHNHKLLNLYNFQLIRQIELKKRPNINKTLINWRIVICVLKLFVRKRFNKSKKIYREKLLLINNEINLKSCLQKYKSDSKLVSHIKPIDCNNINNTHLQLTLKADGIYKKGVFNIYPKLNNINLNLIEYEIIKSTNICYFFNYLDDSIDNYSFIIKLRKSHDYIPNKIFQPLNLGNYEQILFEYQASESAAINKFVKEHPYKKKWWAKYIFKLDLMSKYDYNTLLQNISKLKFNCISNDGWILIDSNYTNILKVKPNNHMTIDLLYINNHLYDAQKNSYQFKSNNELINNKIYRCYFDDNVWNPIDIRTDKIKPNNVSICEYVEKYHSYIWNFNDINKLSPYYHKYSVKQKYNSDITNRIKGSVLDLGCGFKQLKFNYVGIDIDPKLLDKKKNNIYISDLSKPWHLNYQSKIMNYFPNINDFNTKYNNTKFDNILIINSIHYLLGNNNDELFKNINKYSHKNSIIIIKFLDMELLKTLFIDTNIINYNTSFVTKNGDYIKLFYNWCHEIPIIEKLYSKNHIELLVNKYGWQIDSYNYNNLDNYSYLSKWELYLKCFSTLVIRRT